MKGIRAYVIIKITAFNAFSCSIATLFYFRYQVGLVKSHTPIDARRLLAASLTNQVQCREEGWPRRTQLDNERNLVFM